MTKSRIKGVTPKAILLILGLNILLSSTSNSQSLRFYIDSLILREGKKTEQMTPSLHDLAIKIDSSRNTITIYNKQVYRYSILRKITAKDASVISFKCFYSGENGKEKCKITLAGLNNPENNPSIEIVFRKRIYAYYLQRYTMEE